MGNMCVIPPQISMNATQTMEAVSRPVPTHPDHVFVAVELDTDWLVMAGTVKVGSATYRHCNG